MARPRRHRAKSPPKKALSGLPEQPTVLAPIVTNVLTELDVGASVHVGATRSTFEEWYSLHIGPSAIGFEMQYGTSETRWRYNREHWERAHREKRPVLGNHAGLADLFVPLGRERTDAQVTLIVGPFATARASTVDVLTEWRGMTGRHGSLTDPEFSQFVAIRTGTLVLGTKQVSDLEALLTGLMRLSLQNVDAARVARETAELRSRLLQARAVERMWRLARSMIDEHTYGNWLSQAKTNDLVKVGVTRFPEHVVVGLLRGSRTDADPIDDLLRRDAFQRSCATFALERQGIVCGRVGAHAIALLVDASGAVQARLTELVDRVAALARRHELDLHAGVVVKSPALTPAQKFETALAAAENALAKGQRLVVAEKRPLDTGDSLARMRQELRKSVLEDAALLSPRFQRYLAALSVRYAYRLEPVRAKLQAAFDQLTDALESTGALDEANLNDLRNATEKSASDAETLNDAADVYRRAIADVEQALRHPRDASRVRSLRRATTYIREHYGERLSRAGVARVAGFAEHTFSRHFADSEGISFQKYVQRLRIERAKQLLLTSQLGVERVGQLCGFGTRVQFHKAFKQETGHTPRSFRDVENWQRDAAD